MRLAFSGTHGSGKSTLIADLHRALPHYHIIEEPYYSLLEEGHLFTDEPGEEDFEIQLERSIALVTRNQDSDILFDRCPVDFCAYLAALPSVSREAISEATSSARQAIQNLDLIVFVPLERPDRIEVPPEEGRRLRKRVDRILHEMLPDDAWGFGIPVLEVSGTPTERLQIVLRHLGLFPA